MISLTLNLLAYNWILLKRLTNQTIIMGCFFVPLHPSRVLGPLRFSGRRWASKISSSLTLYRVKPRRQLQFESSFHLSCTVLHSVQGFDAGHTVLVLPT